MLLTITTTHTPATDLGYLLHKNPARPQSFPMSFGQAHLFYPEAFQERCTVALLLDVDAVGLIRGHESEGFALQQYVNDRPYVASSFMSVAINQILGTALGGRSKERPELAQTALPFAATLAVVPCDGGEALLRRLWEPLGYAVAVDHHVLDTHVPEWGDSAYFTLHLTAEVRLQELLTHLYVLIPVLDNDKHYYVGDDEVEKLLRFGHGWLATHPERDLITKRYLKHRKSLAQSALARLVEQPDPDAMLAAHEREETVVEERMSLQQQRMGAVLATLRASGARRVLDLGCGEGQLVRALLADKQFEEIVGMDVSYRSLELAHERLHLERLPQMQRERVRLIQGSLNYRDQRLAGYDAAAVVEVIEHLDPPRLAAFERVLWEWAKPGTVVVTTPNSEYNVRWEQLPAGNFRHRDHRFEWTRAEFQRWAMGVAERFGYTVQFLPVGPEDAEAGSPTQMGVWTRHGY